MQFHEQRRWSVPSNPANIAQNSSISDQDLYLASVQAAIENRRNFSRFRRCKEYREILEHVSVQMGDKYLYALNSLGLSEAETKKRIRKLRKFNRIGGPEKYHYEKIGWITPSLLRYLKVDAELEFLFGNLDNFKVCEIGGGFGGQYYVSSRLHRFESWIFFDLPLVLELQKKFLESCEGIVPSTVLFKSGIDVQPVSGDLLVSNYAFSELTRGTQDKYINWMFKNFKKGYVTWNTLSESNLGGFKLSELLSTYKQLRVLEEKPLTAPGNQIIFWSRE